MFIDISYKNIPLKIECNQFDEKLPTLLCLHGIGDSSQAFREIIYSNKFINYNVIAPDFIGFGVNNGALLDCDSIKEQISFIKKVVEMLPNTALNILGHSFGGNVGTYLCDDIAGRITKFVCIESDITQYDDFMTTQAHKAELNGDYDAWFENFLEVIVAKEWSNESGSRYYRSLKNCNYLIFKNLVLELYNLKHKKNGVNTSEIGFVYSNLKVTRVFCYGKKSIDCRSVSYLERCDLAVRNFEESGHWAMLDQKEEFQNFLLELLA